MSNQFKPAFDKSVSLTPALLDLDFLQEDADLQPVYKLNYKIMIADDDDEVHTLTKMILKDFSFEGRGLEFVDTYSGDQTIKAVKQHPDTAVLFLDVVMEESNSGLFVVDYLRNTLANSLTRIILRTGQPGEAPEDKIIRDYDINDYRLKTDLTVQRLTTSLFAALRSYRDLTRLERNRKGLEKMIEASSEMFQHDSMSEFLSSILDQVSNFYQDDMELVFLRGKGKSIASGFILADNSEDMTIIAAKGKYERFVGQKISSISELSDIYTIILNEMNSKSRVSVVKNGFIVKQSGNNMTKNIIFVEGVESYFQLDLINLFLSNYSIALDNFYMNKLISETQTEMVYTLGEVIEAQFEETSGHLKRVSALLSKLGQKIGLPKTDVEFTKIAGALHDVGKIGIPTAILQKPGRLTPEEMDIVKSHSRIGYRILSKSKLEVFQIAAEIALHHHEKYDGTGYPDRLKGDEISIYSRMMAVADVFDAMTHKRVYKDAVSIEETIEYMQSEKGRHFDPHLIDHLAAIMHEVNIEE